MARYYNSPSYHDYLQYLSLPTHFFVFIVIVFLFLIVTWYMNYESIFEDFLDNFKLCLMVFPVILLLFVHWLSSDDRERALSSDDRERAPLFFSLPEKDSLHRVGGSPVGVALLLMLLMFMISHHSSFQEKWFPLFSKRK